MKGSLQVLRSRAATDPQDRHVIDAMISRLDVLNAKVEDILRFARPRTPALEEVDLKPSQSAATTGGAPVAVLLVKSLAMLIQEMTDRECRARLAGANVARLACARDNQPYIVPVHVDLDGGYLYGYASLGQKIEWMRLNPLVCVEIDELENRTNWTSVVVFGHYEELPHTPANEGPRRIAERLFQRHPMWWEPASVPLPGTKRRPPIVFRIWIRAMTGRRAAPETAAVQRKPSKGTHP